MLIEIILGMHYLFFINSADNAFSGKMTKMTKMIKMTKKK